MPVADSGVETRVIVAPKSSLNQGQVLGFWKLELSSCLNEGHVLHSNVQVPWQMVALLANSCLGLLSTGFLLRDDVALISLFRFCCARQASGSAVSSTSHLYFSFCTIKLLRHAVGFPPDYRNGVVLERPRENSQSFKETKFNFQRTFPVCDIYRHCWLLE